MVFNNESCNNYSLICISDIVYLKDDETALIFRIIYKTEEKLYMEIE